MQLSQTWRLAGLALLSLTFAWSTAQSQAPAIQEYHQDFRNRRPLEPSFKLTGPDAAVVAVPEDEGLRIKLSGTRDVHFPVEVQTEFSLAGDFQITGTFELLAADRPKDGYGSGVSLNIAESNARTKFAKVARLMRPKEGSVFMAETWRKDVPQSWRGPSKPTETRTGQLRLARKGESLRYLVSEGPGKEFIEIHREDKFGAEDLAHVHFEVVDSGSPGNHVDARLIDLRILMGKNVPEQPSEPAPLAAPAPGEPRPQPEAEQVAPRVPRGWLAAALVIVVVIGLCFAAVIVLLVILRKR
jgi:hypothetical protein